MRQSAKTECSAAFPDRARFEPVDWFAIVFSPSFPYRLSIG